MSVAVLDVPQSPSATGPNLLTGFRFPTGHVVGPEDEGKAISREEFAEIEVEPGWTIERCEGKLIVLPMVGPDHRRTSRPFRLALGLYWGLNQEIVEDFDLEGWIAVDDGQDRCPDAFIFLRNSPLAAGGIQLPERAPDLAFEIVSPGRDAHDRDYVAKRSAYHAAGVREYVIIDRFERQVLVLQHAPDGYVEAATLGLADAYVSPLLPGLAVPLAEAIGGGD